MIKWFTLSWYQYLFEDNSGWRNILCRIKRHSAGVKWYNLGGLEPDMRCIECGEDLG